MKLALTPEEAAFRDELRTLHHQDPRGAPRGGASGRAGDQGPDRHQSKDPQRARAGGTELAGRMGRQGLDADPVPDLGRRDAIGVRPEPLNFNTRMVGPVIAEFGSQEIKERFLPPTASIDIWWCQGFSEPEAGSDLASLRTTAVRDGDSYVVNGQKTWTTLGQYADWIFCLVRTDPQAPKRQAGISFLLIDMATPGITVRPIKTIDGGQEVNEVFFSDVRVPADQLVGEENQGWTYAKFLLGNERTGIAGVGSTKVRLRRGEKARRATTNGCCRRPAVRGAAGRGRKRAAGTGAHAGAGGLGLRRTVSPTRHRRCSRCGEASCSSGNRIVRRGGRARTRCRPTRGRHSVAGMGAAARRATSTTARRRSTAAAAKCSATSSRRPFWDCEAAMDFQLSDEYGVQYIRTGRDPAAPARQHGSPRRRGHGAAWPRQHPGLDRHPDPVQHPPGLTLPTLDSLTSTSTLDRLRSTASGNPRRVFWSKADAYTVSLLKACTGDCGDGRQRSSVSTTRRRRSQNFPPLLFSPGAGRADPLPSPPRGRLGWGAATEHLHFFITAGECKLMKHCGERPISPLLGSVSAGLMRFPMGAERRGCLAACDKGRSARSGKVFCRLLRPRRSCADARGFDRAEMLAFGRDHPQTSRAGDVEVSLLIDFDAVDSVFARRARHVEEDFTPGEC